MITLITTWVKSLFTKKKYQHNQSIPPAIHHFYKEPYSLIANGARLKLLEAMFNLNLFALFKKQAVVLEKDIINQLKLHPARAKKWLHLLCCEYLLLKTTQNHLPAYQLTHEFRYLMKQDTWKNLQFFFDTWLVAANESLSDVLRGAVPKTSVSWPPKTNTEVLWLENWMTQTTGDLTTTLFNSVNFNAAKCFLDVGGGDGTIACQLAKTYPHLIGAVYNLPKAAALAKANIATQGLSERIKVIAGDFIAEDTFPLHYDLILFVRVLFDWNETINRKLLNMAYLALPTKGQIVIYEFYRDTFHDKCLASEYRYLFHDDFESHVMKTTEEYKKMLTDIGFIHVKHYPSSNCSVIAAQK